MNFRSASRGIAVSLLAAAIVGGFVLAKATPGVASAGTNDWTTSVLQSRCATIVPAVRSAAQSKDFAALEIEAAMAARGCGVEQDMPHAAELYAEAVTHGARDGLASGYIDLYGPNPAETQGIAELERAVKSGNRLAAFDLYFYYEHRLKSQTDSSLAFRWASLAMRSGDAEATALLGVLYAEGSGVAKNVTLGRQYVDRELAAGVPDADLAAGVFTLLGYAGYPKDRVRGFELIRKAIGLGLTRAKVALVQNADKSDYDDGRLTTAETTAYMQEAVPLLEPHIWYEYALASYWYIGGGRTAPDCAHAVPLFLKVADIDDYEPDYDLGYCYYHGDGIAQNQELALKYVKLAAQKGSPNAIAFLKSGDSAASNNGSNASEDYARNYEGYHWNDLHPMNAAPLPGSPAAPGGH